MNVSAQSLCNAYSFCVCVFCLCLSLSLSASLSACCEKTSRMNSLIRDVSCSYTFVAQIWDTPRDNRWELGTLRPQAVPQGYGGP